MPFNNKRNSRDGKSNRGARPPFGSKAEESTKQNRFDDRKPRSKRSDHETGTRYDAKKSDHNRQRPYKTNSSSKFSKTNDRSFKDDNFKREEKPFQKSGNFTKESKPDKDKLYKKKNHLKKDDKPFRKPGELRKTERLRKDTPYQKEESKPRSAGEPELIRLNRYIANAGICSRRKADELIEAGVISINGEVVTSLGTRVNPATDEVKYNGERLKREKMVYVLLNKPKDYITTTDDPQERRTVMQLVEKASRERIYPVGRLDRNTTGLLLMTNDGELAEKLSHPRNNITKIYQVELNKNLTQGDFNKIQYGIELEDGLIKPDDISYVQGASKKEVGIQIHSGKNRIVRRIFEHLGYDVIKLDRVIYANLSKKDLPRGRWRHLEEKEIIQLKHLIK